MVQAASFVVAVWSFIQMWDLSKLLLTGAGSQGGLKLAAYGILFLLSFFVLGVTSYLKQRQNGTLKNRIGLFERVLSILGLA
jgi:hypothetical protein